MTTTAELYRRFSEVEAGDYSPSYRDLAAAVSRDAEVLHLIDSLPAEKRQAILVFAAARFHGADPADWQGFRSFLLDSWERIAATARTRSTQTNEAGRCAVLLPSFAQIAARTGKPLALIEVGASAGLCLLPENYSYSYDDGPVLGTVPDPALLLRCRTNGRAPLPERIPEIAWRAGLDLDPPDLDNPDDMAWLEVLVWPEHTDRLERLRAAAAAARRSPAPVRQGNLATDIGALVAEAPEGTAVVVFHTAVLAYVSAADREKFTAAVTAPGIDWLSNEGSGVLPGVPGALERRPGEAEGKFLLQHNGTDTAHTGPHGQTLDWL